MLEEPPLYYVSRKTVLVSKLDLKKNKLYSNLPKQFFTKSVASAFDVTIQSLGDPTLISRMFKIV